MVPEIKHTENLVKYQLFVTLFLIISCAPQVFGFSKKQVPQNDKFISIHTFQDNRNTEGLSEFFTDPDPSTRELAFEAMGSVQDTLSIDKLFVGLSDLNPDVRSAAGYSIGQTIRLITNPDPVLELKLIRAIASETDPTVAKELFISLGTAFKNPQTAFLSNYQTTNPIILEGISWGIYRAGLNGYFDEPLIRRASQFIQPDQSRPIRMGAAHFFSRTKNLIIDEFETDLIKIIAKENDPEIRMAPVFALGKIESGGTVAFLSSLYEHVISEL